VASVFCFLNSLFLPSKTGVDHREQTQGAAIRRVGQYRLFNFETSCGKGGLCAFLVATHSCGQTLVPAFRIFYAIEHQRGLGSASRNPRYGIRIMIPKCKNQIVQISDRTARVLLGRNGCDSCTQRAEFPLALQWTESAEDSVRR